MIKKLFSPRHAAQWCNAMRRRGLSVGYVPTMGALHDGHLALVKNAVADNDVCCVSIFVNPLQFNNAEDLTSYPATPDTDCLLLSAANCAMVYTGSLRQFFPDSRDIDTIPMLDAGYAASGLEEDYRPGHLAGVATIVDKLFRTVGDCSAYFGEKDFQQTLVVRELAANLASEDMKINVMVHPTVREPSGLAMSSRNQRLSQQQKSLAAKLYQALCAARDAWQNGEKNPASLENTMQRILHHPQIRIEYAAIRDAGNWTRQTPSTAMTSPRALIAAYLGEVRLIDNLGLSTGSGSDSDLQTTSGNNKSTK